MSMLSYFTENLNPYHKLKLIINLQTYDHKIKYDARSTLRNGVILLNCEGFTQDSFGQFKTEEDLMGYLSQIITTVYEESNKIFLETNNTSKNAILSQILIFLPDSVISGSSTIRLLRNWLNFSEFKSKRSI
jgi:hypothetical protein